MEETGLVSIQYSSSPVPEATRNFFEPFLGQPIDVAFKSLRANKYYYQEWRFLSQQMAASRNQPTNGCWKLISLCFCTQCALEYSFRCPFMKQDAENWLYGKFKQQEMEKQFGDRLRLLKQGSDTTCSTPRTIYFRKDEEITPYWVVFKSDKYRFPKPIETTFLKSCI